jgi:hypothetical protein
MRSREIFIEAASGLLHCDRYGKSSFSTQSAHSRRPESTLSGRSTDNSNCLRQKRKAASQRSLQRKTMVDDQAAIETEPGAVHCGQKVVMM